MELVRFIFTIPGVTCFLSEKLCQDPLEKFFGCQRQRGGGNENPTAQEFCKNTQTVRVINSQCHQVTREIAVEGNHSKLTGRKKIHPYRNEDGNINRTHRTFYLHHYVYILYVYMKLYISLLCKVFILFFQSKILIYIIMLFE